MRERNSIVTTFINVSRIWFFTVLKDPELEMDDSSNMVMEVEEGFDAEEMAYAKSW